ncbi:MAG TPA: tetratricopeptide repeat protein, partial [Polyangia bacterium]|nr:tetratricopeptide repeat protein [Polyangia bacterium]
PGATPARAPALAAPWPATTPPVFPQEQNAAGTRKRGEKADAAKPATAGTKPAAPVAAPAAAPESAPPDAAAKAAPAPSAPAASADAILARGQAAFDRGNYAEAIRRAKEATAIGAAVPGHLLIADSYYHLQRYADALREYEAALALEPSNALAKRGRELATKAASEAPR